MNKKFICVNFEDIGIGSSFIYDGYICFKTDDNSFVEMKPKEKKVAYYHKSVLKDKLEICDIHYECYPITIPT